MVFDELNRKKDERLGNGLGDNTGLSWPSVYSVLVSSEECVIPKKDRNIIRELAARVAEIASRDEQLTNKDLWTRHNALQEKKPLIFIDPEYAWYEIFPADQLICTGNLARIWEFKLLKEIYWAEKIKDDRVIEPVFKIYYAYGENGRGLDAKIIGGEKGGAYTWKPALKNLDDIDKIHFKKIIVDFKKTKRLYELAGEILGDILEIKLEGAWWWSFGMTYDLIFFRGIEQTMYDMYDNPDKLHKVMKFLHDENMIMLDFLESNGLLTLNNGGDFIGTGGYGWSDELPSPGFDGKKVMTYDMWGFCESQETVGVSPELFEEFIFPYQLSILQRFGLNIYGCCEPLDKRIEIIKKIPRLRRITVSPWSNVKEMAEKIGKNYIYSRKVNPSDISIPLIDETHIRNGLRETFKAIYKNNCCSEILMRDIRTLSFNPENAIRWTQIAREEAENMD